MDFLLFFFYLFLSNIGIVLHHENMVLLLLQGVC